MSVFESRREWLDDFEFKLGPLRGQLAATLDVLTDLAVVLGTHVSYCRAGRTSDRPMQDMQHAIDYVTQAKELVSSVIRQAHGQSQSARANESSAANGGES